MYKRIVAGIDRSGHTQHAPAARHCFAKALGATLRSLSVPVLLVH
jgi:hypothetical protein